MLKSNVYDNYHLLLIQIIKLFNSLPVSRLMVTILGPEFGSFGSFQGS